MFLMAWMIFKIVFTCHWVLSQVKGYRISMTSSLNPFLSVTGERQLLESVATFVQSVWLIFVYFGFSSLLKKCWAEYSVFCFDGSMLWKSLPGDTSPLYGPYYIPRWKLGDILVLAPSRRRRHRRRRRNFLVYALQGKRMKIFFFQTWYTC